MSEDVAVRLARLEERMKTMQAEYKTDIAQLAVASERLATASERRATAQTRWLAGIGIAIVSAIIGGFVILGILIRFPLPAG